MCVHVCLSVHTYLWNVRKFSHGAVLKVIDHNSQNNLAKIAVTKNM